jgi:mono/diheme cytochrome c family protein
MNKLVILIIAVFAMILSLDSCYYDKADVLTGGVICDTTAFTYSNQVQPIISQYCISCHNTNNSSGGVNLDNYNSVKDYALNGSLLGAINHENGYSNMPKNAPQLNPCDRLLIELWVNEGALNN